MKRLLFFVICSMIFIVITTTAIYAQITQQNSKPLITQDRSVIQISAPLLGGDGNGNNGNGNDGDNGNGNDGNNGNNGNGNDGNNGNGNDGDNGNGNDGNNGNNGNNGNGNDGNNGNGNNGNGNDGNNGNGNDGNNGNGNGNSDDENPESTQADNLNPDSPGNSGNSNGNGNGNGNGNSGGVTSVNSNELPNSARLYQNYPNPFNPTTIIRFTIDRGTEINLSVYDLLGCKIETLIDGYKQEGIYEIEFNAEHLPSGVYFYQLRSKDIVETKKFILSK